MGIGGGIFLIAVGAILAYAINVDFDAVNLEVAGWVLMLAGATVLALTVWFWHSRRQRPPKAAPEVSVLEETRIAHSHAVVDPETPSSKVRTPPEP